MDVLNLIRSAGQSMRRDNRLTLGLLLQSIFSNCAQIYTVPATGGKLKVALLLFLIGEAVRYLFPVF
jgi:hypothetical protein